MPSTEHTVQLHVYGRKSYDEPLYFVSVVKVRRSEDREAALKRALTAEWVELIAFPASAIVEVIPGEKRSG